MKKGARYMPRAVLALDPRAWGFFFDAPDRSNEHRGQTILVHVRGPLMHHDDWCCDSYDAIKGRVLEAIAEKPSAIVLCIDSPGGLVSGCFDTASEIREACAAAAIPLYAYVDGCALSAAYALACASSRIVTPATGAVGSIGCIEMMVDATAANAAMGVRTELVASGMRKTDGNPNTPITDEAIAAVRTNVDALAGVFFDLVAQSRGVSADEVRALQAAIVTGDRALPLKLVDEVATLEQMLAAIAGGTFASAPRAEGEETVALKGSKAYEDAIAALRKAADGDDDEAKKAKRMLAAELAEDDPPAEPKKEEEGKAAKGEDDPPAEPKKDDEEAKALAARALAAATSASKATEDLERRQLISSRPDLDEATRALLASSPLEQVRAYVASAPRKPVNPAAAAVVQSTRGEGQGDPATRLPKETKRAMDQVMGLAPATMAGPQIDGTRQVFPVLNRAERMKYTEARAKAQASG